MNFDEQERVAASFGVAPAQVERDHLISHLLAAIGVRFGDRLHFIGGTALARTHLPHGRLSEDIYLVALGNRTELAAEIDAALPRAVARSHGRLEWDPGLSDVADTGSARLRAAGGLSVKFQLLSARTRILWPAERRGIEQRYADAPSTELWVPTLPAFVASKTSTWHDRRAPRDLWDLWALSRLTAIDRQAGAVYQRFGPTNRLPGSYMFEKAPDQIDWNAQLAGQTWERVSLEDAANDGGER